MKGQIITGWAMTMLMLLCIGVGGQGSTPVKSDSGAAGEVPPKSSSETRSNVPPPAISSTNHAAARTEGLAIIVNINNPLENVSFEELRKLCFMERKQWANGNNVTIVLRQSGQPEREAVLRQIYQLNEGDFNRQFLRTPLANEWPSVPKELSSVTGVRRFVFNVPGAIGFVRACEVDDTVKVIRLDGRSCHDPEYKLKVPFAAK